jgi:hypothetical protein
VWDATRTAEARTAKGIEHGSPRFDQHNNSHAPAAASAAGSAPAAQAATRGAAASAASVPLHRVLAASRFSRKFAQAEAASAATGQEMFGLNQDDQDGQSGGGGGGQSRFEPDPDDGLVLGLEDLDPAHLQAAANTVSHSLTGSLSHSVYDLLYCIRFQKKNICLFFLSVHDMDN